MKYRIALAVSLFALSAGSYATTLCQEKEQNILKEISYAEKHQNQNRIDGLNKALSEVRANCSDSQLRADHQKKIAKQKDEVAERQFPRRSKKAMPIRLPNANGNWQKRRKS